MHKHVWTSALAVGALILFSPLAWPVQAQDLPSLTSQPPMAPSGVDAAAGPTPAGDSPATQPTLSLAAPATTQPADLSAPAPSADQVLSQMLQAPQLQRERPIQPASGELTPNLRTGNGATAPNAPNQNLQREGTEEIDRVGRLQRTPEGAFMELVFDSDGKSMADPPLLILPNLKLMSMESAASTASQPIKFRVTGTITEYHGRNYILLEKAVVVGEKEQEF